MATTATQPRKMSFNFQGKMSKIKLPKTQPLLPLFEAVVNSIHAIHERNYDNGYILIEFERDKRQGTLEVQSENTEPINSFTVTDNGIGFNDVNLDSFLESDSIHKSKIGGKGVGRFIWLKAFKNVEVKSIYKENGITKKRDFKFNYDNEGFGDLVESDAPNFSQTTSILLSDFMEPHRSECPKNFEELSEKILAHLLEYFVLDNCPTIKLVDIDNNKDVVINDLVSKHIRSLSKSKFQLKNYNFELDIYKSTKVANKNTIHFCAHNREVISKPLKNDIPEMNKALKDGDESFYVHAYVKSLFFDEAVNSERTEFSYPVSDDDNQAEFPNMIGKSELQKRIVASIETGLGDHLQKLREQNLTKIRDYVEKKAPQYRPLLKYKIDKLRRLPQHSAKSLDVELFKIFHDLEVEIREEGKAIFKKIKTAKDYEEYQEKYNNYVEKVINVGNTALSKYVIHRKTVLDLLDNSLKAKDDSFPYEDAIHRLVFPLRTTSDELTYESHNLWLIDERLSYHSYLASDKLFKQMEQIESDDDERPDILVVNSDNFFENRYAVSDRKSDHNSMVIIEFKRPMRESYPNDENPINQVFGYIDRINSRKAKDKNRRYFNVAGIPYYCYIICDITNKIEVYARQAQLEMTPDKKGFFGFNKYYNSYIEIISYEKLLGDAKKRNKILFHKLNLTDSDED